MPKRGGTRPGAGRPKGSLARRHTDIAARALSEGISPIEYMISIMRDEQADSKERSWAAEKVAPYLHPRPAPLDTPVSVELPDTSSIEGVDAAQAKIIDAVAKGELTPSQGQHVSALVEARRRSIESGELLRRIEALEASGSGSIGQ